MKAWRPIQNKELQTVGYNKKVNFNTKGQVLEIKGLKSLLYFEIVY